MSSVTFISDDLVFYWQVFFQYSIICSIRIPALNKSDYGVCDVEVAKAARTFYFQVQNKTLSTTMKAQHLQYHEHSPEKAHHHHQEWHHLLLIDVLNGLWRVLGVGLFVAPGISTSMIICHQIVSLLN